MGRIDLKQMNSSQASTTEPNRLSCTATTRTEATGGPNAAWNQGFIYPPPTPTRSVPKPDSGNRLGEQQNKAKEEPPSWPPPNWSTTTWCHPLHHHQLSSSRRSKLIKVGTVPRCKTPWYQTNRVRKGNTQREKQGRLRKGWTHKRDGIGEESREGGGKEPHPQNPSHRWREVVERSKRENFLEREC